MTPLGPTSPTLSLQSRAPSDREKLSQAAKQFEAIFVRQMLASARAAKLGGEDDLFGGQGLDTFRQMQDERFADIAANSGALGLAKSLETQLAAVAGLAPVAAPSPAAVPVLAPAAPGRKG